MTDRSFQEEIIHLSLIDNDHNQEYICMVTNMYSLYILKLNLRSFVFIFQLPVGK
jgi:hypothetical protein